MKEERIYPAKKSIIKTVIIFAIIMLVILYAAFSSRFAWAYDKENDITSYIIKDVVVILIWAVLTAITAYILLTKNYYTLSKSSITHHKLSQEVSYSYSNILYIDEEYTKKHRTLLFYINTGRSVFLVLDKHDKILNEVHKNANHLITKEEFQRKFPKVRL